MNKTLITKALDSHINSNHKRVLAATQNCRESIISMANAARECGMNLVERKKGVSHGSWCALFKSHQGKKVTDYLFEFSHESAVLYMRLYKRHPEPFTDDNLPHAVHSLRDVLIAAEQLPEPKRIELQNSHGEKDWFQELIKGCGKIRQSMKMKCDVVPLDEWPERDLYDFVAQTEPLQELRDKAKAALSRMETA